MYDFKKEAVRDEDGFLMAGRALTLVKNCSMGEAGYVGELGRKVVGYFSPTTIGYQPFLFHGKEGEDVFYGFELEYENISTYDGDKPKKFAELRKEKGVENTIFSYHTDGSLSYGYEVVSSPMSLPFIRKYGMDWLMGMVRDFKSIGASSDNAGLHIHVSRTIGEDVVEKIREEILNNKKEWKEASGRTDFYYADINTDYHSHYNFFGTSSNHPTYEFRLFKGTTLVNIFASRVEAFFTLLYWGKEEKVLPFNYWLWQDVEGMENNIGVKYLRKFIPKPATPFGAPEVKEKITFHTLPELESVPMGTKLYYGANSIHCVVTEYKGKKYFLSDFSIFSGNSIPKSEKQGYSYSHTVIGFFEAQQPNKVGFYYYK